MPICLRIDLDYVPWDSINAERYGHAEPAMILKLLELGRQTGAKFHFFASNRSVRTFLTAADAILGEGHDLDWLTHYPDDNELYEEANQLFALAGHRIEGVALTLPWEEDMQTRWLPDVKFLTAPPGAQPEGPRFFPETARFDLDPIKSGKDLIAEPYVQADAVSVLVARPQVLGKHDPDLSRVRALLSRNFQFRTLREMVRLC